MERLKPTQKSFSRTQEFIEVGMQEGAHEKMPNVRNITVFRWQKIVNTGLMYIMGSETTLQSIGNLDGVTREAVRLERDKFIKHFHGNCPPETQLKYPLQEILLNKPRIPQSGEKLSLAHGGNSARIKRQVDEGITDREKIAINLGLTRKQVCNCTKTLRKWSIELDSDFVNHKKLKQAIVEETDDQKLQEMLMNFSINIIRGDIERFQEQSPFMYLGKLLYRLRLNPHNARVAAEILESIGIPSRSLNHGQYKRRRGDIVNSIYWVIYAKHEQRVTDALRVLEKTGKINKNKVELIGGVLAKDESLPSTSAILQGKNYKSVKSIVQEALGIYLGRSNKLKIADFLPNCPVPVIRYINRTAIPLNKKEEFTAFIIKRYQEILTKAN